MQFSNLFFISGLLATALAVKGSSPSSGGSSHIVAGSNSNCAEQVHTYMKGAGVTWDRGHPGAISGEAWYNKCIAPHRRRDFIEGLYAREAHEEKLYARAAEPEELYAGWEMYGY